MNALATFTNDESKMTARVFVSVHGFAVSLRDDESGETAPYVKTFPTREKADAYAASLVRLS